MSLESIQAATNRQRAGAGNLSASNDPSQWKHDGREQLIKGAELAAAGRTLGMSEEETLAAVSRQFRRQRRADDSLTKRDVLRQMVQATATVRQTAPEEIRGVSTELDLDTAFAHGEDVEYFKQYKSTRADDDQTRVAADAGYMVDGETGEIVKKPFNEDRPMIQGQAPSIRTGRNAWTGRLRGYPSNQSITLGYYDQPAPASVLQDALSRVQAEKVEEQVLLSQYPALFDGSAPSNTDLDSAETALRRHLDNTGRQDAENARAVVRQDNEKYNTGIQDDNFNRAKVKAVQERRRLYGKGGYGRRGDINLDRIKSEGEKYAERFGKDYYETDVLPSLGIEDEIARRWDGVYVDQYTGNTVAVQGPEFPPKPYNQDGGSNAGTGDNLNAPQTAREWAAMNLGETLENMRGADRVPQVDITAATTTAANKVRDYYKKIGVAPTVRVPDNIRSLDELQRVVDRVSAANNGNLSIPDPDEPGSQMAAGRRTTEGALNALNMTLGEQRQLAQALYQLDAAKRSSVNENPTGIYLSRTGEQVQGPAESGSVTRRFGSDGQFTSDVYFDSAPEMDKGIAKAKLARIPKGSTIGVREVNADTGESRINRRSIVTQLAELQGQDAQIPFMGQVQGEKPRVDRFNKTGQDNSADAAIAVRKQAEARAKGKEVDVERTRANQVKAVLVTERERRDNKARADAASEVISNLPPISRRSYLRGR